MGPVAVGLTVIATLTAVVWSTHPTQAIASARVDPEVSWTRPIGQMDPSVAVRGRHVYAAGTERDDYSATAVLEQIGPGGDQVWRRTWSPRRRPAWSAGVAVAKDGSVYLVGTIDGGALCAGWFLRAYTASGELRWHREHREARSCGPFIYGVAVAANERIVAIAVGDVRDGWGIADGHVIAFGPDGQRRWGRPLRVAGFGEDPYNAVLDVAVGGRDRVYAVGSVGARSISGDVDLEPVLRTFGPGGRVLLTRVFRDGPDPDYDRLESVDVRGGSVAVGGWLQRGTEGRAWIARLDGRGSVVWSRFMRGALHPWSPGAKVASTGDRGLVALWTDRRVHPRTAALMAFERDGSRRWFMRLHGAEGRFDATSIALRGTTIAAGGLHDVGTRRGRIWRVTTAA